MSLKIIIQLIALILITIFIFSKIAKSPFAYQKYAVLKKRAKTVNSEKKELLKQYLSMELVLSFVSLVLLQVMIWYFLSIMGIYVTIDFKTMFMNAINLVMFNNAFNNLIMNLIHALRLQFLENIFFPLDMIWNITKIYTVLRK